MIKAYQGISPVIHPSAFVADSADVMGDVHLAEDASIWYQCVVRGDVHEIRIGKGTNVQDLTMIHATKDKWPTHIGEGITIGHHVTLHGCVIKGHSLIGMGSTVLDGVVIEENVVVGAGALVPPGMKVPQGTLVVGAPAKVKRNLTEGELAWIRESAAHYIEYARKHKAG
ncbi:MAG: gamma carbonic anhydrase family protein [Bdellovibrionota bacterium]